MDIGTHWYTGILNIEPCCHSVIEPQKFGPNISTIILCVNRLNTPIKRTEIMRLDFKISRFSDVLSTTNVP